MKILLQCLLLLSCNALAVASEIIAWKTPISRIDTGGKASPKLVRLEKPPEASPFFRKDDELWNVSSIMPNNEEVADKLEWAVWNATSGRLVAKGSWVALFELQHYYDLHNPPIQARVKLDAYRVPADGSPPDASKQPSFSLSYIGRSGQKVVVSNTEGDSSMSVEGEVIFGDDHSLIDMNIFADIAMDDFPTLKTEGSFSIPNQFPVWFARNYNGKQGIDLLVTATLVLADGTPFLESIMRQEGEIAKPFLITEIYPESGNIAIGEKHRLIWSKTPIDMLVYLDNPTLKDLDMDPFAAQKPDIDERIKLNEVIVPNILNPHFHGKVFDIRDALKRSGVTIHDNDFAGFDPKTQRAFLYSSDVGKIDMFEQLFSFGCCLQATNLAVTLRGVGEMRLMTRSGQKSYLSSLDPQSKKTRNVEIEPTIADNPNNVDLRCNYSEKIGEKTTHALATSVTLETGKFLKLSEKVKADGSKETMEIKVEILNSDR